MGDSFKIQIPCALWCWLSHQKIFCTRLYHWWMEVKLLKYIKNHWSLESYPWLFHISLLCLWLCNLKQKFWLKISIRVFCIGCIIKISSRYSLCDISIIFPLQKPLLSVFCILWIYLFLIPTPSAPKFFLLILLFWSKWLDCRERESESAFKLTVESPCNRYQWTNKLYLLWAA